ncbi:hypothetical protein AVEN_7481-1 [Araneus ventricosus]|uniref:ATP-dependent DNA helicase n=1 Tax=Araneus ventricosus TaxID=182803 RepID=A0A4Y2T705_ARAVE|nr:hypothetical protein AVEN_7481-1 [Araneus ventricosus]
MNSMRTSQYNLRRREQRARESLDERFQRRSARNVADRLRRARARSDQQMANRVNSQAETNVSEHDCGMMTEICNFCQALYWRNELNSRNKYTKCCHDGKVRLPNLAETPNLLKELLINNSLEARNYQNHIREYNAALAFASMGAEVKSPPGNGPYCFRIHGHIYHRIAPLYSNERFKPGYVQLYIFDASEANSRRLENNPSCLSSVMEKLDALLRTINPYAKSYLQMHQLIQSNPTVNVKMIFMEHPDLDMCRYNAPTSRTEVVAIFVRDDGEPPANRDICIYPIGEGCKNISPLNQCNDPMVYPLLFPRGEQGWSNEMEHVEERRSAKRNRVTQLQFYAYRLSVRRGFSLLHSSGKLFQQYVVDAYVKTEGSRLNYIRLNQKDLRVELYRGLLDALTTRASNNNLRAGKLVILPSSFQGSPRSMQQNYQDAMAMVRKFGRPDLFVTFTCNPSWPEILNAMQGRERPENRPDIVVRVFKMKLSELLDDLIKRKEFGCVTSYIYVIEFQKRGLPHCHILLTLDSSSKIRTKDDIDKFVSVKLPNIIVNRRLFEIVTKCMVHGPCGIINPNVPCMKDGECSKQFPKAFREETEENVNGYPVYKRRCIESVRVGKHYIDNRWIVPYNPWLSKKIQCTYQCRNGRYVSAPEAMWRLSEFSMSDKSHTVIRLAVHLPEQQAIFFKEGQENEAVERASIKDTTLTAWFKLNLIDEEAHEYYYADIPQYYVFDKPSTKWQKRQRGGQQVIGRMPVVSVQDSERFYLRMLLLRKIGVISFNDLKTIDGTLCETFQEACKVLGLLDGDQHWHDTLLEAARMQMPSYLQILFAIICGFGEVENIPDLWTQHKQSLSEDFVHRYSEETGPFYALAELNELLKSYGLNLRKVNLPSVDLQCDLFRLSYDAIEEQSKANANIEKLNSEQRYAVYKVLHAIYEYQTDMPKCFFLDGPAGTGKTFVYSTLLHAVRGKGDQAIAVASTGIAATLLSGGRTAHSIFKIPLTLNATSTCNLKPNTSEAKILLDAKVIVWDEAPMTHVHAFLAVDRLLKDLTKCDEPFGGKIILLDGDFRQVLPVILRGSRSLTVSSCIKKHRLWSDFFVMKLTENMRAFDSEKEFASWLLHVGEGESGEKIQLPPILLSRNSRSRSTTL